MSEIKSLAKTFTIKITEKSDGTIDIWSKGMPDTRSFGGKTWSELPRSHHLGLYGLQHIYEGAEEQGWIEPYQEQTDDKE